MMFKTIAIAFCFACYLLSNNSSIADLQGQNGQTLLVAPSAQLRLLLEPARAALIQGKVEECRTLVADVANNNKDLPHIEVLMATWLFEANVFQAGLQVLEEIAKSEPSSQDIHHSFSLLAMRQNRYFDAWLHIQAAEAAKPREQWSKGYREQMVTAIRMTKALIADQREDWKASRELWSQLRDKDPIDPQIELGLGRAEFHLGNIPQAETHFYAAAKLGKDEHVPELILASLYDAKGDIEQVRTWMTKGEREGYAYAERIRLEHARWLIRQNQPVAAREIAQSANPTKPEKIEFNFLLAMSDQMEGNHEDAGEKLSRIHQEAPSNPLVSNYLALSLIESLDEGKRGRALQIATANAKSSLDALATLAWIQFRLGDTKSATSTTAIALQQGGRLSRDSAYFLGKVCEAIGSEGEATRLLHAARTSRGEFINTYRMK